MKNETFFDTFLSPLETDDGRDVELMPLLSLDEEDEMNKESTPEILPVLPLKNTVLFPGVIIPITVGRTKSIKLVQDAYGDNKIIGVLAQSNQMIEDPEEKDLYRIGTVARIIKMFRLPDGNTTIIIQGKKRFQLKEMISEKPYFKAKIEIIKDIINLEKRELEAGIQSLKELSLKIIKLNPAIPVEARFAVENIESPTFLVNFLSSNANAEVGDKQRVLEENDWQKKSSHLLQLMNRDLQLLELKDKIQSRAKKGIDQQQRDYYLRQQIRAIHEELGDDNPDFNADNLLKRGEKKKWSEEIKIAFQKEVDKLKRSNPSSPDHSLIHNYLELLVELPWNEFTPDNFDLKKARDVLNEDHFGLEKVKERILEYLAVLILKNDMKAPILCFVGPPGVGKTSLGKSVAKALQRKYIRTSLGGLHDEAEIRGHRKTYIGAMPGRIIQSLKKAKSANPVFVLDEIDKVGSDFRGDPSYALLEVLDPEQNNNFVDNYIEHGFDLSHVLFIATANSIDTLHPALRDRMEIIEISGYSMEEKIQIAQKYLVPKQRAEHGMDEKDINFTDSAIIKIIDNHTKESGVRTLERKIGSVIRSSAKFKAMKDKYNHIIQPKDITKILGKEEYENDFYQGNDIAGVVTGLAWTPVGGDILFVETSLSRGKGKLTLSGQLGDVMKESAIAALSYIKAHSTELKIDYRVFDNFDIHIHIPAGAIPKDGPSAGVTLFISLFSALTQKKVKNKLAMTGEITLRGKILPVGGIKEKVLAAKRAGIEQIILPRQNKKDIEEIKQIYIKEIKFHYVENINDLKNIAMTDENVLNPIDLSILDKSKVASSELVEEEQIS